jgi:nucleotide-binding universal stress UspA family protein
MPSFNHLLVTTDFSKKAHVGVTTAIRLATDLGAKLSVLFVLEKVLPPLSFSSQAQRIEIQRTQLAKSQQELEAYVAKVAPGGGMTPILRVGSPHREIIACIEETGVDLVVMASQGRGSVGQIVFGSTTSRILRLSPCPVLVARQGKD